MTTFIKFLHSPSGSPFNMAYFVGDEVVLPSELADELIDLGYAKEIKDKPVPGVGKKISFAKEQPTEEAPKTLTSRKKKTT